MSVSALLKDGYIVAWHSEWAGDQNVLCRLYKQDGSPKTDEFTVSVYTDKDQKYPAIEVLQNGEIVLAWLSQSADNDDFGIYFRRLDEEGEFLGEDRLVALKGGSTVPALSKFAEEGFMVVWES